MVSQEEIAGEWLFSMPNQTTSIQPVGKITEWLVKIGFMDFCRDKKH